MKFSIFLVLILNFLSIEIFSQIERTSFDDLIYSTIRINAFKNKGIINNKRHLKRSYGTGFFCELNLNGENQIYLVTNRHVIDSTYKVTLKFTKKTTENKPNVGEFKIVELKSDDVNWEFHSNAEIDLAVLPFSEIIKYEEEPNSLFYFPISSNLISTKEEYKLLTSYSDIMMIGYPLGISDKINNAPIFRQGVAATSPNYSYEGKEDFLIDIASFGGSSGSPIFALERQVFLTSSDFPRNPFKIRLIGILYKGVYKDLKSKKLIFENANKRNSLIPTNLGLAVNVFELLSFK